MSDALRFLLFCVALSIGYGIAHDLITAHLAVEYFTVHHPKIIESDSPVVMALLWGVIATFWAGGALGLLIGLSNVVGRAKPLAWPVLKTRTLAAVIVCWLSAMAVLGIVYGLAGMLPVEERRPSYENDRRLVAVAVTHGWSYTITTIVAFGLSIWTIIARYKKERQGSLPAAQ